MLLFGSIIDLISLPELNSAAISERDVGGGECVVSVEWSEAFVSCSDSVSQYVLSVTPPTSNCQSIQDCVVMDGSSVYTRPGTETQYSLTLASQDYDITVTASTCGGSLTGNISSPYSVNLTGIHSSTSYHTTNELPNHSASNIRLQRM